MVATTKLNAAEFVRELKESQFDIELTKIQKYFKTEPSPDDYFVGVRMGTVFTLAKKYIDMPICELEKLLESPIHEARAGALSIMGQCAKRKKCGEARLKEMAELYLRRHDRINNWDLVDLGAYHVVGRYLADKSRKILYKLARSKNLWERRTAIVATAHFILRQGQLDDTFSIAEIILNDKEDLVQKGTGWMLRTAGEVDRARLETFLDRHAGSMPRTTLRYAIEKFDKNQRQHYLDLKTKRLTA